MNLIMKLLPSRIYDIEIFMALFKRNSSILKKLR